MTFSRRTFKTVESFSFTERLPSQREMKRLCEITPDSSGWACGIGIAKIFSAVIFRVPKLQSLNLPIMDFLYWKLWYTVVLSTDQDVCFWKKPGMVPFGQGNVGKRSREEIMRKRTIAHFVRFGIQLARLAITTPRLVRMANSTNICSCKLARWGITPYLPLPSLLARREDGGQCATY